MVIFPAERQFFNLSVCHLILNYCLSLICLFKRLRWVSRVLCALGGCGLSVVVFLCLQVSAVLHYDDFIFPQGLLQTLRKWIIYAICLFSYIFFFSVKDTRVWECSVFLHSHCLCLSLATAGPTLLPRVGSPLITFKWPSGPHTHTQTE